MRCIGVVTVARSDYSTCLPILRAIQAEADLTLHLMVAGTHLSPAFGATVQVIEQDGFPIGERVEMMLSADTPEAIAKSVGLGTIGFAQSFARFRPDLVLLVGDRVELLAVATAALPFLIPLAHVSGGDVTEGAIDNQVRHAVAKLSHLHFVGMPAHADRLLQMGEEPWRVFVTGDPALDLLRQMRFLSRSELSAELEMDLTSPVLIVTVHPSTLGGADALDEVDGLLAALDTVAGTLIFTYPNADAGSRRIVDKIQAFVGSHPNTRLFSNLGQTRYYSLLARADLMVGNSSSGIWEAPSFHLPAVNVGQRQRGRTRAANVIDADAKAEAIRAAIRRGLEPAFRHGLRELQNPYGDGRAAQRVVATLKRITLEPRLWQKTFVDLVGAGALHQS